MKGTKKMKKNKKKQILRYVIPFIAFMLVFGFTLASCGGSETSTKEVSKVVEEKIEPVEEEIIEELIEEPVVIQTNSRTSPAVIGDIVIMEEEDWVIGKVKYEIELLEVISGDEAWKIVYETNEFNSEPEGGMEYILTKFRVKILETKDESSFDVCHYRFSAVSSQGVPYDQPYSIELDSDLCKDLYEAAEHIGWTYFIVDKEGDAPVVAMNRGGEGEIWFQVRY